MRAKLEEYGLPPHVIELLLKGKEASVMYGVLKLNRKGELVTRYHDKKRDGKIEQL